MPLKGPKGKALPEHELVGKPVQKRMMRSVAGDLDFSTLSSNFPGTIGAKRRIPAHSALAINQMTNHGTIFGLGPLGERGW